MCVLSPYYVLAQSLPCASLIRGKMPLTCDCVLQNNEEDTRLLDASRHGNLQQVVLLLQAGADIMATLKARSCALALTLCVTTMRSTHSGHIGACTPSIVYECAYIHVKKLKTYLRNAYIRG